MISNPRQYVLLTCTKWGDGVQYEVYEANSDSQMLHQVGESLAQEPETTYRVLRPKSLPV